MIVLRSVPGCAEPVSGKTPGFILEASIAAAGRLDLSEADVLGYDMAMQLSQRRQYPRHPVLGWVANTGANRSNVISAASGVVSEGNNLTTVGLDGQFNDVLMEQMVITVMVYLM